MFGGKKSGGWFSKLTEGLTKSSKQMTEQVVQVFATKEPLSRAQLEELEEELIAADLGPTAAARARGRDLDLD